MRSRAVGVALCVVTVIFASFLLACGPEYVGYGLLIWSPDESLASSGSVHPVIEQSQISETYTVELDGSTLEVPLFRLELYADREQAEAAAAEYADVAPLYGRSMINALPIRSEPSTTTENRVYRLGEGETVKIVWRDPEITDIHGLVGRWYEAITRDGTRGFVFGYSLEVYDSTRDEALVDDGDGSDELIELLLADVWRPTSFQDMIDSGKFDLTRFSPSYGLFPFPDEQKLELNMPTYSVVFEYDDIARVGSGRYLAEGTTLQLEFRRNNELGIQFILDDDEYRLALRQLEREVREYIDEELERRAEIYEQLYEIGPVLMSNSYGTISLDQSGYFTWTDFTALVPQAIPADAGNAGRISLDVNLGKDLEGSFDGVLTFLFDGINASSAPSFLYTKTGDGIRLIFAPPETIEFREVIRESATPIVAFFSGS